VLLHSRHIRPAVSAAPQEQHLAAVLAAAALSMFVVNLDFFALNLSIPAMADELEVSATEMQWVISGYMLSLAAFLIPGGRLGDILGRRRMLIVGIAIFGGASAAGGAAPSAEVLIGFRIVQGIGAAILFPLCIAVVTNAFPEQRRKRAIGNLYGLAAVATAVGPFFGGFVTDALGWRWVLWINVPIAAAAIGLAVVAVRESRDQSVPRHIDLRGLLAVAAGIAAVTYAVDRAADWGLVSPDTLGLLAAGLALLVVFVAVEKHVRWPLIDLSLFRNRPYVVVTLSGTVANISFVVATFGSTLYLQQVEGYSAAEAGLIFLAASVATAFAGPLSGRLGERFDIPRLMAAGIVVGALGLAVIGSGAPLGLYLAALPVFGFGYGLGWSLSSVGTQTVVPTEKAGAASGVTLAIVIGLGGLCVALAATLIQSITAGGTGERAAIEDVLRVLALWSAACGIGFGVLSLLRPARAASARP
jgi:EmrB/QacA subfamily drug resistance transporter